MKKLLSLLLTLSLGFGFAQETYKEGEKYLRKDKVVKEAKKEAKKWMKQGYQNMPGNLTLPQQFERAMVKRVMVTEEGLQRYVSVTSSAISGSESVAQANAMDNARALLAGQIQSEVSALISSNKANTGYSATEIETIDEFVSSSKTLIQAELGVIDPVIEMSRRVDDKFEFRYTILYDFKEARQITKNIIKRNLEDKLSKNEEELNKILGLD